MKKEITRIYVTKGDNIYHGNVTCDKCICLEIGKKLYWLEDEFANISSIEYRLEQYFGIALSNNRKYFGVFADKTAIMDRPITRITKHHDDVFIESSSYVKRSVKNQYGNYWWKMDELKKFIEE